LKKENEKLSPTNYSNSLSIFHIYLKEVMIIIKYILYRGW